MTQFFELLQYDGYAKLPDFAWEAICIRAEVFDFLAKSVQNSYAAEVIMNHIKSLLREKA